MRVESDSLSADCDKDIMNCGKPQIGVMVPANGRCFRNNNRLLFTLWPLRLEKRGHKEHVTIPIAIGICETQSSQRTCVKELQTI